MCFYSRAALTVFFVSSIVGCTSSSDVGTGCVVNRDCNAPTVCVNGQCVMNAPDDDGGPTSMDASTVDGASASDAGPSMPDSDGGAMDAAVDGGPSDAGGHDVFDAGPPPPRIPTCTMPSCNRCEDRFPGALVCESFDEEADASWATTERFGGTIEESTTRFASGGGALHIFGPPDSQARRRRPISPRLRSGSVHARAYVFLPEGPAVSHYAVVANLQERDTGRKLSLDIAADDSAQTTAGPMGQSVHGRPGSIPREQWVCLEFSADLGTDGDPGSLNLRVDGQQLGRANSPVIHAGGGFDDVWIGIRASPDNMADVEMYVDEFVVSTEGPIGCDDVEFSREIE